MFFTYNLQLELFVRFWIAIQLIKLFQASQCKKCPYSELFWSLFSRIRTEYGEIRSISAYLVQMRENADQNNSEYGHFLRSECLLSIPLENTRNPMFSDVSSKNKTGTLSWNEFQTAYWANFKCS